MGYDWGDVVNDFEDAFSWVPAEVWRSLRGALNTLAATYGIPLSELRMAAAKYLQRHPGSSTGEVERFLNAYASDATGVEGTNTGGSNLTSGGGLAIASITAVVIALFMKGKF